LSEEGWLPRSRRSGFTLIEVIGALLIFSMGVLMVLQLSGTLGRQMEWAAKSGALVAMAHERLDSLEALPFASLAAGTTADAVTVEGAQYTRTVTITAITGLLYQIDIELSPVSGSGPSYGATTYSANAW
jgi:prepilin-type N-terminal cleavage/methylation domain-containing protein